MSGVERYRKFARQVGRMWQRSRKQDQIAEIRDMERVLRIRRKVLEQEVAGLAYLIDRHQAEVAMMRAAESTDVQQAHEGR